MIRKVLFFSFMILSEAIYAQDIPKLRIDLDRVYGGAFSDHLDSIEYIPLESSKISEFGLVSNLIITDSSFVITDEDTQSVLFFSTSGKFLNKISKKGELKTTGAIYDAQNNKIYVAFQNAERNKLVIESYSLEGNFISKGNLVRNSVDFIRNSIIIDENNYWLRNELFGYDSISNFHYFSQYKNGIKIKSAVPFDNLNRYGLYRLAKETSYAHPPIVRSNTFYFSTPIEHKLYKISATDGFSEPLFQIVLPAKFGINTTFLAISENDKKKMDSIVNKNWFSEKTVLGLENIIYDNNKIIFKTQTGYSGYFSTNGTVTPRNFLYKIKNNFLVAFEKIYPDSSTFFLPFSTSRIISYEGFYFNKSYLYTHISSLEMFAAQAATKGKNPQYPPVLQNYFKTQNRKSNPVIVRMKLKD
jgi:hypothetical protein